MITETLKHKLQEQQSRNGLVGSHLILKEYDDAEHNVAAHIDVNSWDITMKVKRGFDPLQDRRQKAYARAKKINDGLEVMLSDILDHECGHWELHHGSGHGCPFDLYTHDQITEAIKKGLPKDKQNQAGYVTNAFEDIIDNANCHYVGNGDFSGQVLFWDHEGFASREQGNKGYTPFYEAFVKLNMHLWGDGLDKALLKRHNLNDRKVELAVQNVVRDLKLPSGIKDITSLFNQRVWPRMAETFAHHMAPLLDVKPIERLSAYTGKPEEGESQGDKHQAGNGIEEKIRTPEGTEEIVLGRYQAGNGPSPQFTTHEQLHALYRRLARDIPVHVEAMTRSEGIEIGSINYRPYDPETDEPSHARLNRLFPTKAGGITIGHQRQPLSITAREKIQRKSFPDFKLLILDTSQSMLESPSGGDSGNKNLIPWGDKSKYHFALLGFYGVENFVQRQGIAPFIRHGAALFSSGTRYKEADFGGIMEVYKHVLSPDWGGTSVSASAITKALEGRESFTLSISDGDIANWGTERDTFRQALQGQHYAHLQIGGRTVFTQDLERWRVPVHYVTKGADLAKLMVNAATSTYRRYTQQ